jgi:hypothetical protein
VVLNQQDLGNTAATAALAIALTIPAVLIGALLFVVTRSARHRAGSPA